jgi:glycosyltransferase involved in cell wall biosynthesis
MDLNNNSLRILVSAYGCEPNKGSEQGVGWQWMLQLARFFNVVILTRSNNRFVIESALPEKVKGRIHFEYYDLPATMLGLKRKDRGLYLYYLLWQWGAYLHARKFVRRVQVNYVIALTFGSFWMPTFMPLLQLPFIWGPVGGGEAVPLAVMRALPWRARVSQYFRYLLMSTVRINPFAMLAISRASKILVRTSDTARLIPSQHADKVHVVLETAVSDEILSRRVARRATNHSEPLRLVFSGRLVVLKNVSCAILALAKARAVGVHAELLVIGDGPERARLELLAVSLGIDESVQFIGSVTQARVLEELANSDVYVFPSLKEGGAWSLMEAMSMGLPVVCANTSGMAVITDEHSAIRVAPISAEHLVAGFTDAIVDLAHSARLREDLGNNARYRIEQYFRWDHKGNLMKTLLAELESEKT